MKLTKAKCKIVGLRLGEVDMNLLTPGSDYVRASFVLLRDDGSSSGKYTKNQWSSRTMEILGELIESFEQDAVEEVFDEESEVGEDQGLQIVEETDKLPQDIRVLGKSTDIPQI